MLEDHSAPAKDESLLRMTTDVVAAFVSKNTLPAGQLAELINTVHGAFSELSGGQPKKEPMESLKPAVAVRKSVTPEYIVCLEDGKKLKMLKRHLRTTYNMTPDEYRAKWGLPQDYPMVAPNYAAQRSEFAKKIGLGKAGGRAKRSR